MKHEVYAQWETDMRFEAHQDNKVVPLESSGSTGTFGVSPKKLLLTALAGCTGMDVASLLPKMRVPFTSLTVRVEGELSEEHPKVYTEITVVYEVGTTEEYREQMERAVELSATKYCGVSAMLSAAAPIRHRIVFLGS